MTLSVKSNLGLASSATAFSLPLGSTMFTLNSPKGGFERKGIKFSFVNKGALGYRGNKINALIKKMLH